MSQPDSSGFFGNQLSVINVGIDSFADDLENQGVEVTDVDWKPPGEGRGDLVEALGTLLELQDRIDEANRAALDRMVEADPLWVDVRPAREVLPELGERELLHAGPRIEWERMCGPQRRGVLGACVFEGWAETFDEARDLVERGSVTVSPTHLHSTVVPMATVVSPSMPMIVVEEASSGRRVYSTLNEGRGTVQWFGAMNDEVLEHLNWIRTTLGPALGEAIRGADPKPRLTDSIEQGLLMGDECHVRAGATTSHLLRSILDPMLASDVERGTVREVVDYVSNNTLFSLNFTMAACKLAADVAHGVEGSTMVTDMKRNGVDFAVRVGGLDEWFVCESPLMEEAIYYSSYEVSDGTPDIGDSSILEVCGLGGMAISAAPTVADFVGGSIDDQFRETELLRHITLDSHPDFTIPNLNQQGSPVGIDLLRVVETGMTPFINSGVPHESSWDAGQIGAGRVHAPPSCFQNALLSLARSDAFPSD